MACVVPCCTRLLLYGRRGQAHGMHPSCKVWHRLWMPATSRQALGTCSKPLTCSSWRCLAPACPCAARRRQCRRSCCYMCAGPRLHSCTSCSPHEWNLPTLHRSDVRFTLPLFFPACSALASESTPRYSCRRPKLHAAQWQPARPRGLGRRGPRPRRPKSQLAARRPKAQPLFAADWSLFLMTMNELASKHVSCSDHDTWSLMGFSVMFGPGLVEPGLDAGTAINLAGRRQKRGEGGTGDLYGQLRQTVPRVGAAASGVREKKKLLAAGG